MRKKRTPACDPDKSSVLIADGEAVTRYGIRQLLNSNEGLTVEGEADTPSLARELCYKLRPTLVIIEPMMSSGEGFFLLAEFRNESPKSRIIVFTRADDLSSLQRAFRAGVYGYVLRSDPMEALMIAVIAALEGKRYLGPGAAHSLVGELTSGRLEIQHLEEAALSNRELQVFRLIGFGRRLRDIAQELHLSRKTIETHQMRIKVKLGVRSTAEIRQRAALFVMQPRQPDPANNGMFRIALNSVRPRRISSRLRIR